MRTVNFTAHNTVTLLHCGAEFFPALIAAIDAAQAEIHLETYIFADDKTADMVKDALKRAAGRGVAVKVITDWIGTGHAFSKKLKQELQAAGVQHRSFNPWFRRGVVRTHRKLCVIDRSVAFLGGLNINDDLLSDDDSHMALAAPRWDFAIGLRGPVTTAIHLEAEAQWGRLGHLALKTRLDLFRKVRVEQPAAAGGAVLAALVIRDNFRNRHTIQRAYLRALGHAHKSAWLANPYFAPGRKLRRALESAAGRGVDVTLLLGVGQFRMQDAVARSFYPKLLKSGVHIVEYHKTQLHAKVAVIDDEWATVGSSNYDGLSLFVNQEANVIIRDTGFAHRLRLHIEGAVSEGVRINPDDFASIRWYESAWYGIAYLMYKNVLRLITLGRYSE